MSPVAEDAMPVELGVIGWPLDVTFSPVMQEAALWEVGLDWRYRRIPVAPDDLGAFVRSARGTMRGVNVTIPHKHAACALCSSIDELASACGAVNTLVFRDTAGAQPGSGAVPPGGRAIAGFNTDGPGLVRALSERAGFSPAGKTVLVLGAGGSATACAAQMARCGANELMVVNRTRANAEALCVSLGRVFPQTRLTAVGLPEASGSPGETAEPADLIISCVPGAADASFRSLVEHARPGGVFMNLAYSSSPAEMDGIARRVGLRVVPGLEMLLWQGVISFEIFTGVAAPVHVMRKALVEEAGEWWLKC